MKSRRSIADEGGSLHLSRAEPPATASSAALVDRAGGAVPAGGGVGDSERESSSYECSAQQRFSPSAQRAARQTNDPPRIPPQRTCLATQWGGV